MLTLPDSGSFYIPYSFLELSKSEGATNFDLLLIQMFAVCQPTFLDLSFRQPRGQDQFYLTPIPLHGLLVASFVPKSAAFLRVTLKVVVA